MRRAFKIPTQWSKVMENLYGKNYCFVLENNYIYGGGNHAYKIECFNLDFPFIINLN